MPSGAPLQKSVPGLGVVVVVVVVVDVVDGPVYAVVDVVGACVVVPVVCDSLGTDPVSASFIAVSRGYLPAPQ